MRKFWIEFTGVKEFSPLNIGCGVTARDENDAINILRQREILSDGLEIRKIVCDISMDDLDGHVTPNIGNIFVRGVWFPQGY